jgi:hypothetical protein
VVVRAQELSFHSVRDCLRNPQWDRRERLETGLSAMSDESDIMLSETRGSSQNLVIAFCSFRRRQFTHVRVYVLERSGSSFRSSPKGATIPILRATGLGHGVPRRERLRHEKGAPR